MSLTVLFPIFLQLLVAIIISAENEEFLRGHLQPLGAHRDPNPVEERSLDQLPSSLEFWNKYLLPSKPVVFRGAASKSTGSRLWTNAYLQENYGDLEFRLEGNKEKAHYSSPEGDLGVGRDSMRNFINTYQNSTKYIVSELPKPMYHEVSVLPFMQCYPLRDKIIEVDMWMNGNNASSVLHKDALNQLNCLFNGTKHWKLIDYKHEDKIYKRYELPTKLAGYSKINVHSVNLTKYPKIAEIPWQYTVLNPGDCLFLPASMYHQVQSYGSHNLAVSLLFKRFQFEKELDKWTTELHSCLQQPSDFQTLDKYSIDWEYSGKGRLSMGNLDLDSYRKMFKTLYNKKRKLSMEKIKLFLQQQLPKISNTSREQLAKKFHRDVLEVIGAKLIENAKVFSNKTALRELAREVEPEEPTNTYNHEYSLIQPNAILSILKICLKEGNGNGSAKLFTKYYKTHLGGTAKFSQKFLGELMQHGSEVFTLENVEQNALKALQPYIYHQRESTPDPSPEYDPGDIDNNLNKAYLQRMQNIFKEDDFMIQDSDTLNFGREEEDEPISYSESMSKEESSQAGKIPDVQDNSQFLDDGIDDTEINEMDDVYPNDVEDYDDDQIVKEFANESEVILHGAEEDRNGKDTLKDQFEHEHTKEQGYLRYMAEKDSKTPKENYKIEPIKNEL